MKTDYFNNISFKAVLFFLTILIFCQGPDLSATSMGGSEYYHGAGISAGYAKDFSDGKSYDGGVDLSYRNGFFAIISLVFPPPAVAALYSF